MTSIHTPILDSLEAVGICAQRRGAGLRLDAPAGLVQGELLTLISQNKPFILDELDARQKSKKLSVAVASDAKTPLRGNESGVSEVLATPNGNTPTQPSRRFLAPDGTAIEGAAAEFIADVKDVFGEVQIVRITRRGKPDWSLLRPAIDALMPALSIGMRDDFEERVAIAAVDARLGTEAAERIALMDACDRLRDLHILVPLACDAFLRSRVSVAA